MFTTILVAIFIVYAGTLPFVYALWTVNYVKKPHK